MPVFVALLFLIVFGPAAPAVACSTGGGSTFCADGWISAPVSRERRERPDPEWGEESGPVSADDIWVEGAVAVDADPPPEDEGL